MNITITDFDYMENGENVSIANLEVEVSAFSDIPATFYDPAEQELDYTVVSAVNENDDVIEGERLELVNAFLDRKDQEQLDAYVWEKCQAYEPDDGY